MNIRTQVSVVAMWALAATSAAARGEGAGQDLAGQGEGIFKQICASCHTIGRGKLVGPDLLGVTERREQSWLRVHIQSPSVHHDQNDPISHENRETFGMRMPDLGLRDQQVEALITYLGTGEAAPAATPALYFPTLALGVLAIVGLTVLGLRAGTKRVEVRP